jgi:glyoxylase-like metal-dependent hydrolase (beta-lactamase superfamily II)
MEPVVTAFFDPATNTVSYIVADPATRRAAIIDPVLDFEPKSGRTSTKSAQRIAAAAESEHLTVNWIFETHAHADHLSAAQFLKQRFSAKVAIGEHIKTVQDTFRPIYNAPDVTGDGSQFDRLLTDGEKLPIGKLELEVMFTPGHTPACVSYRVGDNVFVGDTLFMPDYGTARTDFPGGDARTLYRSIRHILSLPPETVLWMCHDYGSASRNTFAWKSTVAHQRAANIHIRDGIDEESFVTMRASRDKTLTMPLLILPAVQVNIRAGKMPPPDDDGNVYLKLPVDRF